MQINKKGLNNFFDEQIEEEKKENILIFDGHNLFFRCIHVANIQCPDDKEFQYWKYLVLNSIFTSLKRFNPDKLILAIDSGDTWRKSIYPEYKASRKIQRNKSTIDFDAFYKVLNNFLSELRKVFSNIYCLSSISAEADDIIAVCSKYLFPESKITIVSNDSDMHQLLLNKNTQIWNPIKKSYVRCLNPKETLEIKILTGDVSDYIPGVKKKVGPKTAIKMLNEGLSVYMNNESIKSNYERNRKLIDFNYIPKQIINRIRDDYKNYTIKEIDGKKVWQFLLNNRIRKLADNLQIYSRELKSLS